MSALYSHSPLIQSQFSRQNYHYLKHLLPVIQQGCSLLAKNTTRDVTSSEIWSALAKRINLFRCLTYLSLGQQLFHDFASRDLRYRNFYITETQTWNPRNQCSGPAETKCRKFSIKTKPIDLWKRLPVKKAKNNFPIFLSRSHSEKKPTAAKSSVPFFRRRHWPDFSRNFFRFSVAAQGSSSFLLLLCCLITKRERKKFCRWDLCSHATSSWWEK